MKQFLRFSFLAAVLSLLVLSCEAQNFQPFRKGLTYHFMAQDSVYSMRIDSVKVVGGDSVFVFNQTVRKVNGTVAAPGCSPNPINAQYQVQANNQFGSRAIKKQNGYYIFRTSQGQEFLLKTKTPLNQPWVFNAAKNISATLISKTTEPVLTISDSVFTYALSNGTQIKLSKNYGFLAAPNFAAYADAAFKVRTLQFYALPEKGLGQEISHPFRIFNFQVGDKFMYHYINYSFNFSPCWEEWKQYEVLTRRQSTNGDSIYYTLKLDRLSKGHGSTSAPSGMCQVPSGSTLFPPVPQTLVVSKNAPEATLKLSNGFFAPAGNFYNSQVSEGIFKKTAFNFREQQQFSYYQFSPCANTFHGRIDNGRTIKYGIGLGKIYDASLYEEETLEAYIKGPETYGTWRTLAQILATKKEVEANPFTTFPNPFSNELSLKFNNTFKGGNATVLISNTLGQEVYRHQLPAAPNQETNLQLPEMPIGLYLLQVTQNEKTYTTRLVRE